MARFLRQDAVVRVALADRVEHQLLRGVVDLGHHVAGALVIDPLDPLVAGGQQRAGAPHRRLGEGERIGHVRRARVGHRSPILAEAGLATASPDAYATRVPQIHLHAEPGDYAPLVLLPGDPNRATTHRPALRRRARQLQARQRASRPARLDRHLPRSPGERPDHAAWARPASPSWPRSCCGSGARQLIRVGTCGGIASGLRTGDLVIAISASPVDGATRTYLHGDPIRADRRLRADSRPRPRRGGGRHPVPRRAGRIGRRLLQHPIRTTPPSGASAGCWPSRWRRRHSSTCAARAGIQAACLLTRQRRRCRRTPPEETYLSPEELNAAVDEMIEVALIAATVDRLKHRARSDS